MIKTVTQYTEAVENSALFHMGQRGEGIQPAGMELLESIKSGLPAFQSYAREAELANRDAAEAAADEGLTSEINTSKTIVNLADTIRSLVMVLARHPEGYKGDGPRDAGGKLRGKFEPFTPEENAEGEAWEAGPKRGKEWATTGRLSTDCWFGGK